MMIVEPTPRQEQLVRRDEMMTTVSGIVIMAVFGMAILSACIVGWELIQWLSTGVWPALTWADGFHWMGWPYPGYRRSVASASWTG